MILPVLVNPQQQPQPVPAALLPTTQTQQRESTGASRRARLSGLRIVDPNTNRDILTGEEVPPLAVVTPTSAAPPDIPTTGAVCVPAVVTDEVEAIVTVPTSSAEITEEITASSKVEVVVPPKVPIVEEKMAPAVVTATPEKQSEPTVPGTVAVPVAPTSERAAQIVDKEAAIAATVKQENGEGIFGRPILPGNQHMPRPSMTGVNHPPNAAQAIPYPGQPMHGLNVSLCPFYNSESWISGQLIGLMYCFS